MLNKSLTVLFSLFIITYCNTNAQNINLIYEIAGNSFDKYDENYIFFQNPAFLNFQEISNDTKIEISTSYKKDNYKFRFSPDEFHRYGIDLFKNYSLNERSSFAGYASYSYIKQKNNSGNIELDPAYGDVFFMTDSAAVHTGIRSPQFGFIYSYKFTDKLNTAFKINYALQDALKEGGSQAKTIYREVVLSSGLVYLPSNHFTTGIYFDYSDQKENIDLRKSNGEQITLYNFEGDKYYRKEIFSNMNKINTFQSYLLGSSFLYKFNNAFSLNAQFDYKYSELRYYSGIQFDINSSRGFFEKNEYIFNLMLNYKLNGLILGEIKYENKFSGGRSLIPFKNSLLNEYDLSINKISSLFDFNVREISGIIGVKLSVAFTEADSLKYIDGNLSNFRTQIYGFGLNYRSRIFDHNFETWIDSEFADKNVFIGGKDYFNLVFGVGIDFILFNKFKIYSTISGNYAEAFIGDYKLNNTYLLFNNRFQLDTGNRE